MKFTIGSLFSGIGGMDLGFQKAGFDISFQVEIDPFCQDVLKKHWPEVPRYGDVRQFCRRIYDCDPEDEEGYVRCPICDVDFGDCSCVGADEIIGEIGAPNVICAGFECQDISIANWKDAKGIEGARSGLWSEVVRIVRELRPDFLVLENSPEITSRGLGRVLGDLAGIGYDAEWACLPARLFGAPHFRKRWWAVAYPAEERRREAILDESLWEHGDKRPQHWEFAGVAVSSWGDWSSQPPDVRVDDGVSRGMVRPVMMSCGNALLPQIAESIARKIHLELMNKVNNVPVLSQ